VSGSDPLLGHFVFLKFGAIAHQPSTTTSRAKNRQSKADKLEKRAFHQLYYGTQHTS
jgi:hypothetical protein